MLIDTETYVPGKQESDSEPPLRQLKPSEAMRIGAAMRPQCRGATFANGGSCGLGAWWEGLGYPLPNEDDLHIYAKASAVFGLELSTRIHELNDLEHWTREAIADWLEAQGL